MGGTVKAERHGGVSRTDRLLQFWRPYRPRRLTALELRVEAVAAVAFVAAALVLSLAVGSERALDSLLALVLVLSFAFASRVRLYLGTGFAMPYQIVLVPMLYLLPPSSVPALAACALILVALAGSRARRAHPERVLSAINDAWPTLGAAAVFVIAGAPEPELSTYRVDTALTPVGFAFALASTANEYAFVLGLPLLALLAALGIERRNRIEAADARVDELAEQHARLDQNIELHHQLQEQATIDELTGLANHRRFRDALELEFARMRRSRRPLALVLFDIDDFKAVNDTYGHPQGDEVLRAVAGVLQDACRGTDVPARYGGGELALILPETDIDGAATIAEAVRIGIARLAVPRAGGEPLRVTVSAGVGALGQSMLDPGALIQASDDALYEAKRGGKNQTRVSSRAIPRAR